MCHGLVPTYSMRLNFKILALIQQSVFELTLHTWLQDYSLSLWSRKSSHQIVTSYPQCDRNNGSHWPSIPPPNPSAPKGLKMTLCTSLTRCTSLFQQTSVPPICSVLTDPHEADLWHDTGPIQYHAGSSASRSEISSFLHSLMCLGIHKYQGPGILLGPALLRTNH